MPESESLQPDFRALLAQFHDAVGQRLKAFPEIDEAVPSPEERQLAAELSYVLSGLEAEMPQHRMERSVFNSIFGRLRRYAQIHGRQFDNEWKMLVRDAAVFPNSPFARAASLAAMAMCLMLYCDTDGANKFATAALHTAGQKIPERKLHPLIRYGWGEQGFKTPVPASWQQVLEERARA